VVTSTAVYIATQINMVASSITGPTPKLK